MSEVPVQSPEPQTTGLEPNVAGALSYILGIVTGVIFLVVEKRNPFVRFHAAQSIAVSATIIVAWVAITIVSTILGFVPIVGWLVGIFLSMGFGLACLGLWLYLMYQAFQGNEWEVPWLGAQARRYLLSSPAA